MKWIDFEKQTPLKKEYYLCKIWGWSVNAYGGYSKYEVHWWDGKEFVGYPFEVIRQDERWEFEKVIWWAEIPDTPLNPEHYKETVKVLSEEKK